MYQGRWLECFSWKDGKLTVWEEGHQGDSSPGKHQVCGDTTQRTRGPIPPCPGCLSPCPLPSLPGHHFKGRRLEILGDGSWLPAQVGS